MTNKYQVGEYVRLSKVFITKSPGSFIKCDSFIARVIRVDYTPTNGPTYALAYEGKTLPICYWESDIDGLVALPTDEEAMWTTWGDQ